MDLSTLSVRAAVAQMKAAHLAPSEYAKFLADRAVKSTLNAFINFDPDAFIKRAMEIERTVKPTEQPLFGLPLAVKDNIEVKGFCCTGGTTLFADYTPKSDAAVVAMLKNAGAYIGGKTNLHEMSFGITSNNVISGPVRNPYAHGLIAGGSSGGTAAAIASGLMPAGLGTDTGGSLRIPASLCGVVGFRPTMGRYDYTGAMPLSHTRDTIGIMANGVDDVAFLDSMILCITDDMEQADLKTLRLGIPREFFYENLDPDVASVMETAIEHLKSAGIEIITRDIPGIAQLYTAANAAIILYEAPRDIAAYLKACGFELPFEEFIRSIANPDVKRRFEAVNGPHAISKDAYDQAITIARPKLQAAYATYFREHRLDAALIPATPIVARPIGQDDTTSLNGKPVPVMATYVRNCDPSANAGLPSISVPAGLSRAGLPVGLELDGPAGSDRHLLAIARTMQTTLGRIPAPSL